MSTAGASGRVVIGMDPHKRSVTIEEVGDSALYFLSPLSRGVTGEVHHVDAGYHVVGMKAVDAPDISVVKD